MRPSIVPVLILRKKRPEGLHVALDRHSIIETGVEVFSASIEIVLTIAYREAVSRRHAYLTLEHLLYALAHDSEGERILKGAGADLVRLRRELNQYLESSVEELRRGQEREPEPTAAFRRVLPTAVRHVQ